MPGTLLHDWMSAPSLDLCLWWWLCLCHGCSSICGSSDSCFILDTLAPVTFDEVPFCPPFSSFILSSSVVLDSLDCSVSFALAVLDALVLLQPSLAPSFLGLFPVAILLGGEEIAFSEDFVDFVLDDLGLDFPVDAFAEEADLWILLEAADDLLEAIVISLMAFCNYFLDIYWRVIFFFVPEVVGLSPAVAPVFTVYPCGSQHRICQVWRQSASAMLECKVFLSFFLHNIIIMYLA